MPHARADQNSRGLKVWAVLSVALLAGSWLFFALQMRSADLPAQEGSNGSSRTFKCNPGPWGDLECTRVSVGLPDHFITDATLNMPRASWFFRGHSRDQVEALFRRANLNGKQLDSLLHKSEWIRMDNGTKVIPEESTILSLQPESRRLIYSVLEIFPDNEFHHLAFTFRRSRLAERFEYSGLKAETIQLFNQLIYPRGENLVMFADVETLMRQIPEREERLQLIKTLSRRNTLLVKLHVGPHSDVEQLLQYWGQGGRAKDLKPLLESLSKVPGGSKIDIGHLLPPFARQRVYTYPFPSNTPDSRENCHWTALNFFNDNPSSEFLRAASVEKVIEQDYVHVENDWRMGDVIFLVNSQSQLVHSAVYIADDIVFTKNGVNPSHPWIYMTLDEMLLFYETPEEPLEKWVYRRKDLAGD
ncbi:MAG: hypothetical protein ACK4UN_09010 [Limisphaerales bacterium]